MTQITWHIYADWDPHLQNPRRNFWRLLLALNILIPVYASLYLLIEQSFSPLQRYLGLLFHLLVCDLSFHFISLVVVFAILSTFVDFFPPSQNHRIVRVGKDLERLSGPTPLPKQVSYICHVWTIFVNEKVIQYLVKAYINLLSGSTYNSFEVDTIDIHLL